VFRQFYGLNTFDLDFFVGPTLSSFPSPDHLMNVQAQTTQDEAQATQVEQEYRHEEKLEHKAMDVRLLVPKSWSFWMTSVNPNSRGNRLTDHDKRVVQSLNHIIRHQNEAATLLEQLLNHHHQATDADEDTQPVMTSPLYIASTNDSSKSALDDFGQKWKQYSLTV
jgi:hypothetical protein